MKKLFVILSLLLIGLVFDTAPVMAADINQYSVEPIYPSNQTDKELGYFNLLVKTGQKQTIKIKITNSSAYQQKYSVWVNPAKSGSGGVIHYADRKIKSPKKSPIDIRKAITVEKHTYTLKRYSEIEIPITIKVPKKKFKGKVLAGIDVIVKDDKEQTGQIKNVVRYETPIVLQESTQKITPKIKLNNVNAILKNGYPNFQVTFSNSTPTIIHGLKFDFEIRSGNNLIMTKKIKPYELAPYDELKVDIPSKKKTIKAGDYQIIGSAEDENGNVWHFNQDFKVSLKKSNDIDDNSVYQSKKPNIWIWIAAIFGALSLIAVIGLVIFLVKQNKNQTKSKRRK